MYILEVNHSGGIHRFFLLPGQTYTVGRKECRVSLPNATSDNPSISRHHATIVVGHMARYAVFDPRAQLDITIKDYSKHGTFVNRERIGTDNSRFVYAEDHIRFGTKVSARVVPIALVLAIPRTMNEMAVDEVVDCAVGLGTTISEERVPQPLEYYEKRVSCLGFLFVAQDKFVMDSFMMEALGYGYTLVTVSYLQLLLERIRAADELNPSDFPLPMFPTPASAALRSVHYRRPAQAFYGCTEFLSSGAPVVSRVFRGYTFLLVEDNIKSMYNRVLEFFGGAVVQVALDNLSMWFSLAALPTTLCLVSEDRFKSLSELAVLAASDREGRMPTKHDDPVIGAYSELFNNFFCLVPEEAIQLAFYRDDSEVLSQRQEPLFLQRVASTTSARVIDEPSHCEDKSGESTPPIPAQKPRTSMSPLSHHTDPGAKTSARDSVKHSREPSGSAEKSALSTSSPRGRNSTDASAEPNPLKPLSGRGTPSQQAARVFSLSAVEPRDSTSNSGSRSRTRGSLALGENDVDTTQRKSMRGSTDLAGAHITNTPDDSSATSIKRDPLSSVPTNSSAVNGASSNQRASRLPLKGMSRFTESGVSRRPAASAPPVRFSITRRSSAEIQAAAKGSTTAQQRTASSDRSLTRQKSSTVLPERRPVVIHEAAQVSAPRKRIEAVRINPAASDSNSNRSSRSRECSVDQTSAEHPAAPDKRTIRRSEPHTARLPSSIVDRSNDNMSDDRNIPTPLRLTTPRTSRPVTTSSIRMRLSTPPRDSSGTRRTSPYIHTSARRRRSGSNAGSSAPQVVPGQIPGLRSGGIMGSGHGPSNTHAEGGHPNDTLVARMCEEFMKTFLDIFIADTERMTRVVLRQTYLDATTKQHVEMGGERIVAFLQQLHKCEQDVPAMQSTERTRKYCHEVRQKATYILRKIRGTYDAVHAEYPQCLTRARDALTARATSPNRQYRYHSVSTVNDSAYRRQSYR